MAAASGDERINSRTLFASSNYSSISIALGNSLLHIKIDTKDGIQVEKSSSHGKLR